MAQLPPTASPMDLMAPRAEPPPKMPKSAFEQAMGRWRLQVPAVCLSVGLSACPPVTICLCLHAVCLTPPAF